MTTGADIPEEQGIFNAAWLMLKHYYGITQDNGEQWTQLLADYRTLFSAGHTEAGRKLAQRMAAAILQHIEAISLEPQTMPGTQTKPPFAEIIATAGRAGQAGGPTPAAKKI